MTTVFGPIAVNILDVVSSSACLLRMTLLARSQTRKARKVEINASVTAKPLG